MNIASQLFSGFFGVFLLEVQSLKPKIFFVNLVERCVIQVFESLVHLVTLRMLCPRPLCIFMDI